MDKTEQALQDVTKDLQGIIGMDGVVVDTNLDSSEQVRRKVNPKEAQDKITPDMPKFKKVYGKMKDFERQVQERDTQIKEMQTFMKNLNAKVEKVESDASAAVEAAQIAGQVEVEAKLLADLKKATESDDLSEVVRIQNELLNVKVKSIKSEKPKEPTKKTEEPKVDGTQNAKFQAWLGKNKWYESNGDARIFADVTAKKLEEAGKSFDEILKGVDEKMKKYADVYGIELEEDMDGDDVNNDLEELIDGDDGDEEPVVVKKKAALVEEPTRVPKGKVGKVDPKLKAQAERMAKLFDIPVSDMLKNMEVN